MGTQVRDLRTTTCLISMRTDGLGSGDPKLDCLLVLAKESIVCSLFSVSDTMSTTKTLSPTNVGKVFNFNLAKKIRYIESKSFHEIAGRNQIMSERLKDISLLQSMNRNAFIWHIAIATA